MGTGPHLQGIWMSEPMADSRDGFSPGSLTISDPTAVKRGSGPEAPGDDRRLRFSPGGGLAGAWSPSGGVAGGRRIEGPAFRRSAGRAACAGGALQGIRDGSRRGDLLGER